MRFSLDANFHFGTDVFRDFRTGQLRGSPLGKDEIAKLENDLTAVSRLGLPPLAVTARLDEVEDFVAAVPDALAILLRRPKVEQVVAVARAGRTLPQKSTSFEPKPLCGLVFSAFDG